MQCIIFMCGAIFMTLWEIVFWVKPVIPSVLKENFAKKQNKQKNTFFLP